MQLKVKVKALLGVFPNLDCTGDVTEDHVRGPPPLAGVFRSKYGGLDFGKKHSAKLALNRKIHEHGRVGNTR